MLFYFMCVLFFFLFFIVENGTGSDEISILYMYAVHVAELTIKLKSINQSKSGVHVDSSGISLYLQITPGSCGCLLCSEPSEGSPGPMNCTAKRPTQNRGQRWWHPHLLGLPPASKTHLGCGWSSSCFLTQARGGSSLHWGSCQIPWGRQTQRNWFRCGNLLPQTPGFF